MKLFIRGFIVFIFLIFYFGFFIFSAFAAITSYKYVTGFHNTSGWTNLNNALGSPDGAIAQMLNSSGLMFLKYEDGFPEIPVGSSIVSIDVKATFYGTGQWNVFVKQTDFYQNECIGVGLIPTSNTILRDYVVNIPTSSCFVLTYPDRIRNGQFLLHMVRNIGFQSYSVDAIGVRITYAPPVTPTPTPTPTPTSTSTPTPILKTPLILIPGMGGSELKTSGITVWSENNGHGGTFVNTYLADEEVWVNGNEAALPGDDDYFDVLKMQSDGTTSEANLALTGDLFSGVYQGTIDFFVSNGYTLNQDLFVFPYDWRKDISGTKDFLDEEIQQIKTQTGSLKVDIVAHSMGGLVARNYIADASKALNVRKLFTLGTPHLGSVDALKGIKYGNCLTGKYLNILPLCIGLTNSEIKDVLQNMISSYELVPSRKYFDFYTNEDNQHPYPYRTEAGGLNYDKIKDLLTNLNFNTSLFVPSEAFHILDSSLSNTNGVDITLIAGSGKNTLGQIVEENNHKDVVYINGDGTIPLMSASLVDYGKSLILLGDARVYYTNQDHGGIVSSGPALNLVKNILEGNDQLPSGVSTSPYFLPLVWWLFSKHSPVDMNIYDSSGNHTGPTADGFETNIPGSSYDTLGDEAFVFIPDNGTYSVNFEATGNGSFDFRVRKFENENTSQEILYNDVPLTTSTRAELTFNTSSGQNPIMYVDEDGNGTTDKEVNSYTDSNPTSTPTPTLTPQPTSTPTVSPTISLASQEKSSILEESSEYPGISDVKEVAGAKTFASATKNNEKKMNKTRLVAILISMGGLIAAIYLMKFRKK